MKICFRVDSSVLMGNGHVMRCLTLAKKLKKKGHECIFICRSHEGDLRKFIYESDFRVIALSSKFGKEYSLSNLDSNTYAKWLEVPWQLDADQTKIILKRELPDWLIVDHYALDSSWESEMAQFVCKIMIIDDLADRNHTGNLLLDQSFGRKQEHYLKRVPRSCEILVGAKYSLLREEFSLYREKSLSYRKDVKLDNILVSMGGADKDNFTSLVLQALNFCNLRSETLITVVMGGNSPFISNISEMAPRMRWKTEVLVDVEDMARVMCRSDLAIGAAGSTSWERCTLGLPTIQILTASNQSLIAKNLANAGAVKSIKNVRQLPELIDSALEWMPGVSKKCRIITDGKGVERVLSKIEMCR